jgi:transcriptional regulator with XRE-family HTH domain
MDRGLKQTEVAELLGVVYQTVVKWEHNLIPVGAKSRRRVLTFLGYEPTTSTAKPADDSRAG